jgi:hypothetical protein
VTALIVNVNRPELLDDLLVSLRRNDCLASRTGSRTCVVEHPAAVDDAEARVEIGFFLRAWQSQHPDASATLTGG